MLLRQTVAYRVLKKACEFCCASLLSSFFSASTPGAFHRIHEVSTSTSQRPPTTLISSPEPGLGNSVRGFLCSSNSTAVSNPTYIEPAYDLFDGNRVPICSPERSVARMFAAFWMFAACFLLGVLAKRISRDSKIGIIVAGTALLTPWFFEARPIGLRCASVRFHSCRVPACCLPHSVQRNVELARHCDGRRQSRGGDIWLFQRARPGGLVRIRITLLCEPQSAVSSAYSRYGWATASRWCHSFCSIGRILAC